MTGHFWGSFKLRHELKLASEGLKLLLRVMGRRFGIIWKAFSVTVIFCLDVDVLFLYFLKINYK
jgi:hypothetical protein